MTLGRSDLSRLLFDRIKATTEVIFGDEIVGLRNTQIERKFISNMPASAGSIW